MPTLTTNYSLKKPLVNNATDEDLWGGYINDSLDLIDTALQGLKTGTGLADNAVTLAKMAHGTAGKYLGFDGSGAPAELTVSAPSAASESAAGIVELATTAEATTGTDTARAVTPAGVAAAIPSKLNATGSAPLYACRAWVNFNGTGTVAIRASGNVSSITDNGTGDYTVNFATAMQDADYSFTFGGAESTTQNNVRLIQGPNTDTPSTTTFRIRSVNSGGTNTDFQFINVSIFR